MAFIFYNKHALDVAKKIERNQHIAVASLNLDIICVCLSEPDINISAIDSYGNTLLHSTLKNKFNDLATQRQIIEVLEILLDKGVDINAKNGYLETVLHLAIDNRMKDVVQMLIKRGVDLNVCDVRGNKLAHFFINKILQRKLIGEDGSADFLDFLVQQGVDINSNNSDGESVMSIAVKYNLVPIITTCLKHSMNPANENINILFDKILNDCLTSKNKNQKSELEECLAMLITKGANVNKKNAEGLTPLQLAFQRKNVQLMLLLEKFGADLSVLKNNIYLQRLCARRTNGTLNTRTAYKDITQLLIRAGCDVNASDTEGRTPLYRATEAGNIKMVRVIIELGVDVNDRGSHECQITPLHRVVMDENKDIFKILIAAGAKVNTKSTGGSTPLHLASQRKNFAVAESLLNAGARVDAVDDYGENPLDVAIKYRRGRVAVLLLSRGARIKDYATFREIEKLIGPFECNSIRKNCIKLMAVGMLGIGKQDSRFYSRNQFHRQFYVACLKEVDRMKAWKINDRVSFYDFLHIDWNFRCSRNFIGNEKILELLGVVEKRTVAELIKNALISNIDEIPVDLSNLKAEFPLYHEQIYTSYKETFSRRPLLKPAKCAWYTLTDINLPDICVLKILAHLPNDTLRVMIEGAQSGNLKRPLIMESDEAVKKRRVSGIQC